MRGNAHWKDGNEVIVLQGTTEKNRREMENQNEEKKKTLFIHVK